MFQGYFKIILRVFQWDSGVSNGSAKGVLRKFFPIEFSWVTEMTSVHKIKPFFTKNKKKSLEAQHRYI